MAINFDDFGVCPSCNKVNLRSDERCRYCNTLTLMTSIDTMYGKAGCIIPFVLIGGGFLLGGIFGSIMGMGFFLGGGLFAIAGLFIAFIPTILSDKMSNNKINKYKEEALILFETLASEQSNSAESAYNTALREYSASNYVGAIVFFEKAIAEGFQNDDVELLLAASYLNTDKYGQALNVLENLWERSKSKQIAETLVRANLAAGISNIKQVKRLLELKDDWILKNQMKSEIIMAIARYYCKNNVDSIQPDDILEQALKLEPHDRTILICLCNRHLNSGDLDIVKQYYSQIRLDELEKDAIEQYAQALDGLNEQSLEAIKVYKRALELNINDLNIIHRLARSLMVNKKLNEAIEVYVEALKSYPEDPMLKYNLALCYMSVNKLSEAIIELQYMLRNPKALSSVPESVVRGQLGKCFLKQNLYDLALNQYLMADRSEDSLLSLYELGLYFEENGDAKNAVKCWSEIYSSNISFRDVAERLQNS